MKNQISARLKSCVAAAAGAMFLGAVFSPPAAADETGLTFHGGIGVIPVSSVNCVPSATPCVTGPTVTVTVNQNVVRGVQPAGQIWVIGELDATVNANGSITVQGNGLVLGGGNNAGRAPANTVVLATLICQAAAPFTESRTSPAGVPLSPTGDFQINDMLSPPPTFPCASPMLLIRNAVNLGWFAVGIPGSGRHDR
jgi:hypothetical protein